MSYIHKKGDCVGWFKHVNKKFLQGTCLICFTQKNPETRLLHRPKLDAIYVTLQTHPSGNYLEYCIYLGKVLDRLNVKGEECGCKGYWLHECEIHKQCTITYKRDKVHCCNGCNEKDQSITLD